MLQLALNGVEMSCNLYLLYKLLRFMKHVRFVTRSTGTRMAQVLMTRLLEAWAEVASHLIAIQ